MMNLEKKIGSLLLVGFRGETIEAESEIITDLVERGLGGVILFDRFLAKKAETNNITGARQVQELTSALQDCAQVDLLIAVDQEGGKVNRFRQEFGFTATPTARELGQMGHEATQRAAEQTAKLLSELGINFNLAPVVDLDLHPENPIIGRYGRSFSNDPDHVFSHAKTWVEAHRQHGVATCIKHFPGHGSSENDSHFGFVDISSTWQPSELSPYRQLLAKELVDAVMTGHLFHRDLDSVYPATLSRLTITGLLRDQLDYQGLVISDDMQMRAISERYSFAEAAWRALAAGVDVLVYGNNLLYEPDTVSRVIAAIGEAVAKGSLAESRIDSAFRRCQRFKQNIRHNTGTHGE